MYIIHSNQTGYVKDHYIGETVRSIIDTMDFTEKKKYTWFDDIY